MNNEQKLKALIEKAVEGGWKKSDEYPLQHIKDVMVFHAFDCLNKRTSHIGLGEFFFSHDFLKGLFGQEKVCAIEGSELDDQLGKHKQCVLNKHFEWDHDFIFKWEFEAQQLAITKPSERLDYLYKQVFK